MKAKVCELYASGLTMQEVGDSLGISRARVHQIVSQLIPGKVAELRKQTERQAMSCPHCRQPIPVSSASVVDSRKGRDAIRRRRKCFHCHKRFTTYEITEKQYQRWTTTDKRTARKNILNLDSIEV
jgi:hypothetical protein